jgi:NAD(P)H-dependent flavin oxidoreductase YrpB (nitropropane dioxygenase family)
MSLKTRVTTELNIQHPILLAPMAGVSGGALRLLSPMPVDLV